MRFAISKDNENHPSPQEDIGNDLPDTQQYDYYRNLVENEKLQKGFGSLLDPLEVRRVLISSGLPSQDANRFLLTFWLGDKQLVGTKDIFEYISQNIDQFRGISSWNFINTPGEINWLIRQTVDAKKSIAQVIITLQEVFSMTHEQTRKVIIDLYSYFFHYQSYGRISDVTEALLKELPLNEEDRLAALKQLVMNSLENYKQKYSAVKSGATILDTTVYRVGSLNYTVGDLEKRLEVKENFLDDHEVFLAAAALLRVMLTSEVEISIVVPQAINLVKSVPLLSQVNFDSEIEFLWNRVVEFGSFTNKKSGERSPWENDYDQKMFLLLQELKISDTYIKELIKKSLLKRLSSGSLLQGLIETYVKPDVRFSDLLQDAELLLAASTGRQKALENLRQHDFQDISDFFHLSANWSDQPEDFALVKKAILQEVNDISYSLSSLRNIKKYWLSEAVLQDVEIKQAIRNAVFSERENWTRIGKNWKELKTLYEEWSLPTEEPQAYARDFILDKIHSSNKLDKFRWARDCVATFPEVIQSPEIHDVIVEKLLSYKYEKEPYGYRNLSETIEEMTYISNLCGIESWVLSQWKVNLAVSTLTTVTDQSLFSEFHKNMLRYLDLSPDEYKSVVFQAFLGALARGDITLALFQKKVFAKSFPKVEFSELPLDKLHEAGKSGMEFVLREENLQNAIKIQELCDLPSDFFELPDVAEYLALQFAELFLSQGLLKDLNDKFELFRLSPKIKQVIDEQASQSQDLDKNLIRFIRFLGDEAFSTEYPKTFSVVAELILSALPQNSDIADYFLEQLSLYHTHSWVLGFITQAVKHYSVAIKFLEYYEYEPVWENDPWVDAALEEAQKVVQKHDEMTESSWQSDDDDSEGQTIGFVDNERYKDHPWLFGKDQVRLSSRIARLMKGEKDSYTDSETVFSQELQIILQEMNATIENSYQRFLSDFSTNSHVNDDDKNALINSDFFPVKMTSLQDTLRFLVARYIVQSGAGNMITVAELSEIRENLSNILSEGFSRYIHAHAIDIPLYDKLYEEFDNFRDTGRYPLEVYLGRDGVYAWLGRRAQDVARRRKLGLIGRKQLKEQGEILEIQPKYIVYPRYFRDSLNYETKRLYLEQEGICLDADPMFYDTGYTGTIPEQIMRVMGFEDEEIESRIRLLSARSSSRRVTGIPEDARSEIIEYIEHNAKLEQSAEGLFMDEATGRITHVSRPTDPEEQFYFMMVKQAISRHYWIKEQLYSEPSWNINLDSKRFAIRIRKEYKDFLSSQFLSDPREYILQHGTLLKGSRGEGPYPDEEIILFTLVDGVEVVSKKIEFRKSKEARKELSILIQAEKAGLPTAKPVGFLSAKEEGEGSYLLMKKVEGISGRNFEKYLMETLKYSPEKRDSVLHAVTEKLEELALMYRTVLHVDKHWRIKDTIIQLNEATGEVESVIPIDWERVVSYDPDKPKKIDSITSDNTDEQPEPAKSMV